MQFSPKTAKYENSEIFSKASLSSLDVACVIACAIDISSISSKLFHLLPCLIAISFNVVTPF